ncbi:neurotrophin 1 [Drosophila madeirensis]|uniref:Neurotrophin 1 n=1 Tax=Drosophila madeirensis TaxID=30013 RepID=A0AAU9F4C9_DROMD
MAGPQANLVKSNILMWMDRASAGLNGSEVLSLSSDEWLDLYRNSGEEALPEDPQSRRSWTKVTAGETKAISPKPRLNHKPCFIFKVPTCCSCQVYGYRRSESLFPALSFIQANGTRRWPMVVATVNEEDLDSADDSEEDELRYPTLNGRDTNELQQLRGRAVSESI